jgi:hypothetical protein
MTGTTSEQAKTFEGRRTFDFLSFQEKMRSKKRRLFYFFALNMLGTVLAFYVLIAFFFLDGMQYIEKHGEYRNLSLEVDSGIPRDFWLFFIHCLCHSRCFLVQNSQLKDGGSIVASTWERGRLCLYAGLERAQALNVVKRCTGLGRGGA